MKLDTYGKRYFAYIPTKTYSGKWLWWRYYIRATAGELTLVGESGIVWKNEYRRFTESEWTLELIKNTES
mgnify:CR=1 FL=1